MKHSVTSGLYPMFPGSRFGTEDCRDVPSLKGECWTGAAAARGGLSHPYASQTGALVQAGPGVPVP